MNTTCAGKVAVVMGGSGGIGRCIALTLAREGAAVAVNFRANEKAASELVAYIRQRNGRATAIRGNVHNGEDCCHLIASATEALGPIDICIVGPGGDWRMGPVHQLESVGAVEDVQREVSPLFHTMPLVLPGMYERKWGRLIGISMLLNHQYNVHALGYETGKAARTAAVRFARDQAFKHNVTVNILAPGPVSKPDTLAHAAELCEHGPSWQNRKDLCAQDIAEGVAFLCSEAGAYITGGELPYVPHQF